MLPLKQLKMTEPIQLESQDSTKRLSAIKWWKDMSLGFRQDLEAQYHILFPDYPKRYPLTGMQIEYLYDKYRC